MSEIRVIKPDDVQMDKSWKVIDSLYNYCTWIGTCVGWKEEELLWIMDSSEHYWNRWHIVQMMNTHIAMGGENQVKKTGTANSVQTELRWGHWSRMWRNYLVGNEELLQDTLLSVSFPLEEISYILVTVRTWASMTLFFSEVLYGMPYAPSTCKDSSGNFILRTSIASWTCVLVPSAPLIPLLVLSAWSEFLKLKLRPIHEVRRRTGAASSRSAQEVRTCLVIHVCDQTTRGHQSQVQLLTSSNMFSVKTWWGQHSLVPCEEKLQCITEVVTLLRTTTTEQ